MASNKIADDTRFDPRIKAMFGAADMAFGVGDAGSREPMLKEANSEEAIAQREAFSAFGEMCDTEEMAPSKGLTVTEHNLVSQPDGNTINIRFIRPDSRDVVPCVYYIHGGGMTEGSCYEGNYRAWGR